MDSFSETKSFDPSPMGTNVRGTLRRGCTCDKIYHRVVTRVICSFRLNKSARIGIRQRYVQQ